MIVVLTALLAVAALVVGPWPRCAVRRSRAATSTRCPRTSSGCGRRWPRCGPRPGARCGTSGLVRYDAFADVGGRLSWSLALLDDGGNGVVLTAIHGRSEARSYAKSLAGWTCEQPLSPEEEDAVGSAKP